MVKKQRIKVIISVSLFCAIFAALLAIASVYDLQISQILTKNSLPAGSYFSTNGFGLFFEAVGSSPIYLMVSLGATIAFWWAMRKKLYKALSIALPIVFAVIAFVGVFLFVKDIFSYVGEHMHDKEYMSKGYILALTALLSLMISGLLIVSWKQIKPETNDKLITLSIVILCTMVGYLIIHFIKGPIGRVRFRTMNYSSELGFDNYTPWYVSNGKRNLVPMAHGVEIDDSCKSFPSGHTFSAALVYSLICIPDLLESWNKKWVKAVVYASTITFTGIVAISRILVGAHYMSDVLFGGTISFLCMMIGREIFVFKGAHFKIFKKSISAEPVPEAIDDSLPLSDAAAAATEETAAENVIDAAEDND